MIKPTIRLLAAFTVMLPQPGCTSEQNNVEARKQSPLIQELIKTTRSWDGAILPAYPSGQPEITILRITIPAGARLEIHRHPVINAGLLLSGQLTVVTKAGETLQLKAGEPIVEVVNTFHYGVNQGELPAEIIVFYVGVVDTPITVTEPR